MPRSATRTTTGASFKPQGERRQLPAHPNSSMTRYMLNRLFRKGLGHCYVRHPSQVRSLRGLRTRSSAVSWVAGANPHLRRTWPTCLSSWASDWSKGDRQLSYMWTILFSYRTPSAALSARSKQFAYGKLDRVRVRAAGDLGHVDETKSLTLADVAASTYTLPSATSWTFSRDSQLRNLSKAEFSPAEQRLTVSSPALAADYDTA